jgi:hypothetical protein
MPPWLATSPCRTVVPAHCGSARLVDAHEVVVVRINELHVYFTADFRQLALHSHVRVNAYMPPQRAEYAARGPFEVLAGGVEPPLHQAYRAGEDGRGESLVRALDERGRGPD